MKFLFIVQGEGRGHMTQAITLAKYLREAGHEIVSVLIGSNPERTIPDYFYKNFSEPIFTFDSPDFVIDKNNREVKLLSSFTTNLKKIKKYWMSIKFINNKIKTTQPDLVINFYDLLVSLTYIRFRPKVPFISLAHQHYLVEHPHFKYPSGQFINFWIFKAYDKMTGYKAKMKLGLSFTPQPDVLAKKLIVVPPLLRPEMFNYQTRNDPFLLIYIINAGYAPEIINWQAQHPEKKISIFCDKINPQWPTNTNLTFNKLDDQKFLDQLKNCSGYISTAGFESICEAAYLGKPILAVPTQGQFEQSCNALDLVESGLGTTAKNFDLSKFLNYLQTKNTQNYKDFKNWAESAPKKFLEVIEQLAQN